MELKNQIKWIIGFLLAIFGIFGLILYAQGHKTSAFSKIQAPEGAFEVIEGSPVPVPIMLFKAKIADLKLKLRHCESRHNVLALNPNDLDNTPSYSLYQWKPSTWKGYVKKYDLFEWQKWEESDYWNSMYSEWHQEIVVARMFLDPDVNLQHEFPGCSRIHNLRHNYARELLETLRESGTLSDLLQ